MQPKLFKEPPVKRQPGKPAGFRRKTNQVRPNHFRSIYDGEKRFTFDSKRAPNHPQNFPVTPPENNSAGQSDKNPSKTWWVHLQSGFVIDSAAKHQKAMRQAVWLYLYFLMAANRQTGKLFRRISTITAETGFNRRSAGRWLKVLREKGYIETHSTGRALQISITKWKPITGKKTRKETTDRHG